MKSLKEELKGLSIIGTARKLGEWGTAFGVFWLVILPKIEDSQDDRIEKYHAEDNSKVKFRTLLSEELEVKSDRIHIHLRNKFDELDSLKTNLDYIFAWVKDEVEKITPRLFIHKGREFWLDEKGELHAVHRGEDGRGMYFSNNKWNNIFW
jgi:hypothetical protein